ncbi:transcriptional regulator NrdR [Candidatus Roizmanbacteria bacterium RIFCSPHIGHO2_01_FULL_39_12b]|uniref:Transcriptional repressor NrdR n=1 Tax=Candidatus Roizmanbacteria bacterium RIFCSPHIGHO2_01_FULL_39_12b TaxID=1802030 RepID=A0A1F7G8I2_9BACT|nr:MAG: transcriptional regulator NrdR [Candidatus Roizmanbacteria bacterium RIFCSPHIGHO2_01_FULL_39_12b]OGK46016.1 MAG: transcriptional regulator NrdR [Candidatus Roizmanbacteria bacterium RIFCSPLOWO2_01_FULL_39_19]
MRCIFCNKFDTDVVETRPSDESSVVRRRRECGGCLRRFTTYERVEQLPLMVIKRDGRHERFDRNKLLKGILKSTEKTRISLEIAEEIVTKVETKLKQEDGTDVESQKIGAIVADKLKKIDKVAYIRFASVFRRFVDVEEFKQEIRAIA